MNISIMKFWIRENIKKAAYAEHQDDEKAPRSEQRATDNKTKYGSRAAFVIAIKEKMLPRKHATIQMI